MTTPAITLALSALATVMFLLWCVLTVIARRLDRRQMADQAEVERRWPMLAVEDYTEDGELAPDPFWAVADRMPDLEADMALITARAALELRPQCEAVDTVTGLRCKLARSHPPLPVAPWPGLGITADGHIWEKEKAS
jgi:hypothetical protein